MVADSFLLPSSSSIQEFPSRNDRTTKCRTSITELKFTNLQRRVLDEEEAGQDVTERRALDEEEAGQDLRERRALNEEEAGQDLTERRALDGEEVGQDLTERRALYEEDAE